MGPSPELLPAQDLAMRSPRVAGLEKLEKTFPRLASLGEGSSHFSHPNPTLGIKVVARRA